MIGKKIVDEARKYVGTKYTSGGITPQQGFDCSGLVCYVFKKVANLDLPHQTAQLINKGKKVTKDQLKQGDVVFPTRTYCGIYEGNNILIYVSNEGVKRGDLKYLGFNTAKRLV